jgi:hypothetical protein
VDTARRGALGGGGGGGRAGGADFGLGRLRDARGGLVREDDQRAVVLEEELLPSLAARLRDPRLAVEHEELAAPLRVADGQVFGVRHHARRVRVEARGREATLLEERLDARRGEEPYRDVRGDRGHLLGRHGGLDALLAEEELEAAVGGLVADEMVDAFVVAVVVDVVLG